MGDRQSAVVEAVGPPGELSIWRRVFPVPSMLCHMAYLSGYVQGAYYAKDLLRFSDVEALSNPKESRAPVGCAKRGPLR